MPVNLGDEPQAGFDRPMELLRDCHRRIERFLGVLLRVAAERYGGPLDNEQREAIAASLR